MNIRLHPVTAASAAVPPAGPGKKRIGVAGWAPILVLPLAGWIAAHNMLPSWGLMWLLCCALFAGCKWLTLHDALRAGCSASYGRIAAYLVAWPGMDAAVFLRGAAYPVSHAGREWAFAAGKLGFGVMLTWGLARGFVADHPAFAGWTGMVGLIFVLHFGTFHLLSIAWRLGGVPAEPIMRAPLLATSLAEFWGRRWNAAFHELVHRYAFRPLLRAIGAAGATIMVFLLSGLVHEVVISVPARGGYGGPTAYFLLHGAALLVEHSTTGRHLGLGAGWRGRAFALVVAAAPVGLLFHPPFVRNVILPFLHAIGAT